jgi:DeoR family fructose operon transcriptional repressor
VTVVLVDSSKIGQEQTVRFAELRDVDVVVTDADADPDDVEALERLGVEVVVA